MSWSVSAENQEIAGEGSHVDLWRRNETVSGKAPGPVGCGDRGPGVGTAAIRDPPRSRSTAFAFGVSQLPRGRGPIPRGRGPGAPARLVALTPPLSPDSRYILLPVVLRHLHMHLQEQKDLIMCARILSNVFCLIKKNSSVSKQRPSRVAPIQRLLEIKCSMSAE